MTIGIHDGAAADSGGVAVYTDTDRDNLRISLLAASAGGMSVVIRDKSTAHHMAKVLGSNNQTPIVVDPGRWRHQDASPQRPIGINADGLTDLNLRTWGHNYVSAAGISAVLTPSLFVPSQEWETLQALTDTIGNALDVGDPIIGLIATDAAMLDVNNITAFLELLEPIRHLRLGFVFGGDREALAYRDRLTGLRTLLEEHTGAWLIGIDGLVATEALCAGAGLVGVGVRPGMRWPAVPGKKSNGGRGRQGLCSWLVQ
ncbi:hypothetical protein [Mycobacteroides abscessus]|uniref:hypothetical protein n=1 Tax=Mycobacteroides abscessus TaxID=36809 RepID=UPI000D3E47B9|nr:hypothetical protein [Mycobacteroides abscessus]PVA36816.1 hypothetical protein DDJ88_13685 [Mycobacteroides abscessus]PVA44277.1 hypothetical protein DDJ35_22520 [Mycobacteroides abscessus]RIQ85642.1 hypothetical protein D2E34_23290 [Mycobacteroides abscessus]RIQ93275.1 hypothetical protein D2E30_21965 [Mycobacteroides abscessus]